MLITALTVALLAGADDPVRVVLDMDANTTGIQTTILVEPGATSVEGVAVFVYDPMGTRRVFALGYLGGINRWIALGHAPTDHNLGTVTAIVGTPHTPVNPQNTGWVDHEGAIDKAFAGPEIQYTEAGGHGDALLPHQPSTPILTATIRLHDASPGDVFRIALADNVVLWTDGHNGTFSTLDHVSLDSGGDVVPDNTPTVRGLDADTPITVPPAAYSVDFVDGVHAPATIVVRCPSDFNGDGVIDTLDVLDFLNVWVLHDPRADFNHDGHVDTRDVLDFLNAWVAGC
jgi:hypothetical protein